jgi:hypothetical protein
MIRHASAACLLSLLILAVTAIVVSRSGPIDDATLAPGPTADQARQPPAPLSPP